MKILHETPGVKWEVCVICNRKFRWIKGYKGRVHNTKYLEAHARAFCQRDGRTKRLFAKLYSPHSTTIVI